MIQRTLLALSLLVGILCVACESRRTRSPEPDSTVGESAVTETPPLSDPVWVERSARTLLTASQFHSARATEGLSQPVRRVPHEKADTSEGRLAKSDPRAQKRFTRVKGADGFFCGTLNSGSVTCWGRNSDTLDGKFVDLALGQLGFCALDLTGVVRCQKVEAPPGRYSQLAASGKNYCALSQDDLVTCFGPQSMAPPPGFQAQFVSVGDRFACAADVTKRLVCWGETAPLMLPIDSMRVKDIAAGAEFVCVLTPQGEAKCFGQGPRLPAGRYATINAGFREVCGVKIDGSGVCAAMNKTFPGPVRRFAVARSGVCAHLTRNHLECEGDSSLGQLSPPLSEAVRGDDRSEQQKVSSEKWLNFLGLFPDESGPNSFGRDSKISLGDRLPVEFNDLIGGDPNRYRTGSRYSLAKNVLGISLFDLKLRQLQLFVFVDRTLTDQFSLVHWRRESEAEMEKPDGTAVSRRTAKARESKLMAKGTLEVVEREGEEVSRFVKEHQDGSRPISSIDCGVQKTTWVTTISSSGKASREKVRVEQELSVVNKEGCAGRFPFATARGDAR